MSNKSNTSFDLQQQDDLQQSLSASSSFTCTYPASNFHYSKLHVQPSRYPANRSSGYPANGSSIAEDGLTDLNLPALAGVDNLKLNSTKLKLAL
jgi:hypothetical protein